MIVNECQVEHQISPSHVWIKYSYCVSKSFNKENCQTNNTCNPAHSQQSSLENVHNKGVLIHFSSLLWAAEQAINTTFTYYHLIKMLNMLTVVLLHITEQHNHQFRVMFPADECTVSPKFTLHLALFQSTENLEKKGKSRCLDANSFLCSLDNCSLLSLHSIYLSLLSALKIGVDESGKNEPKQ